MTKQPGSQQSVGRRQRVLHLLREAQQPLGIAEIANRLGIHANTVRFHLDTLVEHGQVERSSAAAGNPGRPPQLFAAVRAMDPTGPRHYQVLAEALATTLEGDPSPRARSLDAGRQWGRGHASALADVRETSDPPEAAEAVEHLVVLLDDLDFAPEQPLGDHSQIGLRRCPFLELAVDHSEVVCPIHLGLMQGAMESWGSPVTVERLDAFVEPDLCVAHLKTIGAS